jgi:hypothetical protein
MVTEVKELDLTNASISAAPKGKGCGRQYAGYFCYYCIARGGCDLNCEKGVYKHIDVTICRLVNKHRARHKIDRWIPLIVKGVRGASW